MHLFVSNMADSDISAYEFDDDDLLLMPNIIPQFDLQAESPDLDLEDSEGEETGKDITGTDIEWQNQEAEMAAGDALPVQIERRFNKLSTSYVIYVFFEDTVTNIKFVRFKIVVF